jgi:hypothetical protein
LRIVPSPLYATSGLRQYLYFCTSKASEVSILA